MKNIMHMCIAIVLCLCMGACGKGNPDQSENPSPSSHAGNDKMNSATAKSLKSPIEFAADPADTGLTEGLELTPSAPAKTDVQVLQEPPELVVSTMNNADSVIASCGNYMWSREMPDGSMTSIIACGAHPLDEVDQRATLYTAFSTGSLPALPEGQMPGAMIPVLYLDFGDVPPETVTVHRWPSAYIGHASEYAGDSEDVTVDPSDGFAILSPGDGEYVYEVHADWGGVGYADYVFNTVPQEWDTN